MCMLFLIAIVSVEILHPLTQEVGAMGAYDDCSRCSRAFASVQDALLTCVQLSVVGDDWGALSLPLIEAYPLKAGLIIGAMFVIVNFGMLNLLLTAIVEGAQESRELKEKIDEQRRQHEFEKIKVELIHICATLDKDESGSLTLHELEAGFDSSPAFKSILMLINVNRDDLKVVFSVLDEDNSGTVSYVEFINQLHMMKTQGDHTMLLVMKAHLKDMMSAVYEELTLMKEELLGKQMSSLQQRMNSLETTHPNAGPERLDGALQHAAGVRHELVGAENVGMDAVRSVKVVAGLAGDMEAASQVGVAAAAPVDLEMTAAVRALLERAEHKMKVEADALDRSAKHLFELSSLFHTACTRSSAGDEPKACSQHVDVHQGLASSGSVTKLPYVHHIGKATRLSSLERDTAWPKSGHSIAL